MGFEPFGHTRGVYATFPMTRRSIMVQDNDGAFRHQKTEKHLKRRSELGPCLYKGSVDFI